MDADEGDFRGVGSATRPARDLGTPRNRPRSRPESVEAVVHRGGRKPRPAFLESLFSGGFWDIGGDRTGIPPSPP
ncbi:hypothetical protein XI06_17500 [Bradyrhizobium sp. CCBAU 11434]|nr:hypothetical protein [Bradyrhizobium sp. CCBAU 11434]